MNNLLGVAFGFVLLSAVGCALTDYELITDNDQLLNGGGSGIVNTNGKAHVIEGMQYTESWPDGSDNTFSMVDQAANGDQILTTYNNFSTDTDPSFHDDLYCNPDWQGCAAVTADNPLVGDLDMFDYRWNGNCSGARTISMLYSTTRYYGECGRVSIPLRDRISLLNMGRYGHAVGSEGLFYDLTRNTLSITLDNGAGDRTTLPVTGDARLFLSPGSRKAVLDLTNPMLAPMGRSYADFLANQATHATTVTATLNGISMTWTLAGHTGLSNPTRVLANVNAHY